MKSDTLSLTNIINELKLLQSKYLLLLAKKFKEPDPRNAIFKKEKHKISRRIRNNYLPTKYF